MATFTTEVLVKGSAVEHKSVTWEAEIGGDLPGRLSTSTGLSQRKGKIEWAETDEVTEWGWNPLSSATLPKPGDPVEVYATLDGTRRKVFAGKIDDTTGSVLGGASSTIVDYSDDLSKVVRVDPLLQLMPGRRNTTDSVLSPSASVARVVWEALEKCGFRHRDREVIAPYTRSDVVLYAPLQGSTWSDWRSGHGTNRKAGVTSTSLTVAPKWTQDKAANAGSVSLTTGYAYYACSTTLKSSDGFGLYLYVGASHNASATIRLQVSDVTDVSINISANRTVTLKVGTTKQAMGSKTDFRMANPGVLCVQMDAQGGFYLSSYTPTDDGYTFMGGDTGSYTGVGFNNSWINEVELTAEAGSQISHLQVFRDSNITPPKDSLRTAVVNLPAAVNNATYTPSVRDVQAKSILEEISKAICAPMWFDGRGVFHMEYSAYLRAAASVGTITPATLTAVPWKSETLMTASTVNIASKVLSAARSKSGGASVTVWQGPGSSLASNEAVETFVGPDEGEDWIEPDTTFIGDSVTAASQNKTQTTAISNQTTSVYMTEMGGNAPGDWSFSCTEVTPWQWRLNYKSLGTAVSLNIPTGTGYGLSAEVRGDNTPIFRAGALAKAVDRADVSVATTATTAPILEHDSGIWGQGVMASDLAKDTVALCGSDRATYFSQVESFWDPALDVGAMWTVDLSEGYGVRMTVHVLSVSSDHTADKTTVTFRMVKFTTV